MEMTKFYGSVKAAIDTVELLARSLVLECAPSDGGLPSVECGLPSSLYKSIESLRGLINDQQKAGGEKVQTAEEVLRIARANNVDDREPFRAGDRDGGTGSIRYAGRDEPDGEA